MSPWIVSARYDLTWFAGPALLGAALALLLPPDLELGAAGWLLLVVAVDVGHTWVTLFRTLLDPAGRRAWGAYLVAFPLLSLVGATLVQVFAPGRLWTAMAAIAVFHFVRQQLGFTALYRAREGLPRAGLEAGVERALVQLLCLAPMAFWLTHPRAFAWFVPGEFPVLPAPVFPLVAGSTAGLALVHLGLRLRSRRWSPGRDLWLLSTAASWTVGIVLTDGDAPFTVANVLAHGVPYYALVAHTQGRKGAPVPLALLVGLPVGLALTEELAWDAGVWQEHVFTGLAASDLAAAVLTPLLVVPQLTHYLLDGVIWKGAGAGVAAAGPAQ